MQAYSLINKIQFNKKKKKKKKKKKNIDTWRCLLISSYRFVSAMKKKIINFVLYIMNFFISVGRSRCIFKTKI